MASFAQGILAFVQDHRDWTAPIVFALAFCESFAFVSLFVPATVILVGLGGLIGAAGLAFWPIGSPRFSAPLPATGLPMTSLFA